MSNGNLNLSVIKALEILELLDAEGALGVTEIARRLNLDKSSVFRALNTLKSKNYVRQEQDTLRYANSYKLFEMGHNVVRETGLTRTAYRFMRELAGEVTGAVSLGVRDGLKVVYIDKIESEATMRVSMRIGQSLPLYCTGVGKALLAFLPEDVLAEVLSQVTFEKNTPRTHGSAESLAADLKEVRQRGFGLDDEEHIPGLFCVAAPVFDGGGRPVAAISVSNLKIMLPDQESIDRLSRGVVKAAADLPFPWGDAPRFKTMDFR